MTPPERAYLRYLAANAKYAKAVAQEWAVKPRKYDELPHGYAGPYEAEAFLQNITREWGWKWQG